MGGWSALSYPVRMVVGIDESPGGFVGRASNRNRTRRRAAHSSRPGPCLPTADDPDAAELTHTLGGPAPDDAELAVLSRALDGTIPGVAGSVVADALNEAVKPRYLRQLPGEVRPRFDGPLQGNPLERLLTAGVVAPGDIIPAGLAILSTVVRLCQDEATPTSRRAA